MPMLFSQFGIHIKCLLTKVTIVYVARMSGKGPRRCSGGSAGGGKGDEECSDVRKILLSSLLVLAFISNAL
jgi:hypothetical protein